MKYTKITIVGDIMLKKEMISNCNNYDDIFFNVKSYFDESDLVLANLETPIVKNFDKNKVGKYSFVAPSQFALAVKNVGIDIVSTANNHCLDNGKEGLKETLDTLDEIKLEHVGTYIEKSYLLKNINGKNIAILANTYGTNAFENEVYISSDDEVKICMIQKQELNNKIIRKIYKSKNPFIVIIRRVFAKFRIFQFQKPVYERNEKSNLFRIKKEIKKLMRNESIDYIIMLMHDGGQNNKKPIKRTIKNIKYMKKIGVNAIITNHEHMIHKVEVHNNDIVTYSLGNFIGINGILEEPYDKMQEYSIGINIYFNENNLNYTFTIFKNTYDKLSGKLRVNLLYDLILAEKDNNLKEKLIRDNNKIVSIVTERDYSDVIIKREYEL